MTTHLQVIPKFGMSGGVPLSSIRLHGVHRKKFALLYFDLMVCIKRMRHESDHTPPSNTEVWNEWRCTSILHTSIRLHGVHRKKYALFYFDLMVCMQGLSPLRPTAIAVKALRNCLQPTAVPTRASAPQENCCSPYIAYFRTILHSFFVNPVISMSLFFLLRVFIAKCYSFNIFINKLANI